MPIDEALLSDLESCAAIHGIRVALVRAHQLGQWQAYTECLLDVGAIPKADAGAALAVPSTLAPGRSIPSEMIATVDRVIGAATRVLREDHDA